MTTKHSPGPWEPIVTKHEAQYFQITAKDGTIVGYSVGGMPFELQKANAFVMAAGPELLALLQDLWIWFKMTGNSENVQGKRFKERMLAMGYELP